METNNWEQELFKYEGLAHQFQKAYSSGDARKEKQAIVEFIQSLLDQQEVEHDQMMNAHLTGVEEAIKVQVLDKVKLFPRTIDDCPDPFIWEQGYIQAVTDLEALKANLDPIEGKDENPPEPEDDAKPRDLFEGH